MRFFLLISILFMSSMSYATNDEDSSSQYRTIEVKSSSISSVERDVREAAVYVLTTTGHGSGSLINYKGTQFILTAQHVASGEIGSSYIVKKDKEARSGILIYSDLTNDMAVLWLKDEFISIRPMKFSPVRDIPNIGDVITYSGYPSSHDIMTYRGRVAGFEVIQNGGKQILLHTFGWFGCSGSVVFDGRGNIVGILWGIDVLNGIPVESMIWVSPIENLRMDTAISEFCNSSENNVKACR